MKLKEQYEALMSMHATPGWALFMEDAEKFFAARVDVRNATPETLRFVQGELSMLGWVLAQRDVIRHMHDALEEREAQDPETPE